MISVNACVGYFVPDVVHVLYQCSVML